EKDARALLTQLRSAKPRVTQAPEEGDPLMLPPIYVDRGVDEIARDFGTSFAQQVGELESGQWYGPITSGYGLHLVYIGSRRDARLPSLDQVRSKVVNDWQVDERRAADARIYERLRSRYEVITPAGLTDRRQANER
ncbi:MAG: peptidylprolyl isomerase, partial [Burkholderiales bacterium]